MVVIIGLLAAVIVPEVVNKVDEARVAKAKEDRDAVISTNLSAVFR